MVRKLGSYIKGKNINVQILHNQNLEKSIGVGYTASKKIGNAVIKQPIGIKNSKPAKPRAKAYIANFVVNADRNTVPEYVAFG